MSNVPARVAADADEAMNSLREMAATVQPTSETPPANDSPEPVTPPVAATPPAPPAPVAVPVDLAAELAKMNRQLGSLQGRLEQSELERQRLQRQIEERPQQPAQPPAPPTPPPSLVTAKDREEFGEDLLDLITRAVRQEIGGKFDQIGARLSGLEGRIGKLDQNVTAATQTAVKSAWDTYLDALKRRVPTWEQVNTEEAFLDWLEIVDTFSGKKRLDLLLAAHEAMDLERVVSFFTAYNPALGTAAPAAPAAAPTAPQPAAPAAPAPLVDPATLAAPATQAPAPAPSQPTTGRIWKQSEVDALYERKNKGLIKTADFNREEANYLEALAAGRVVANA